MILCMFIYKHIALLGKGKDKNTVRLVLIGGHENQISKLESLCVCAIVL